MLHVEHDVDSPTRDPGKSGAFVKNARLLTCSLVRQGARIKIRGVHVEHFLHYGNTCVYILIYLGIGSFLIVSIFPHLGTTSCSTTTLDQTSEIGFPLQQHFPRISPLSISGGRSSKHKSVKLLLYWSNALWTYNKLNLIQTKHDHFELIILDQCANWTKFNSTSWQLNTLNKRQLNKIKG